MKKITYHGGRFGLRAVLRQDSKFDTVHHVQLIVPGRDRDSYRAIGIYTTREEALDACPRAVWDYVRKEEPAELARILPWRKQKDISIVLGVNQGTVSNWAKGKTDMAPSVRAHVARIFGVCYDPSQGKVVWTEEGREK